MNADREALRNTLRRLAEIAADPHSPLYAITPEAREHLVAAAEALSDAPTPTREEMLRDLAKHGLEPPEEPGVTEWTLAFEDGPQPVGATLDEALDALEKTVLDDHGLQVRGSDAGPREPTPDRLPEVERALEMFMAEVGEPYMASYRHAFDLRDGRNRATLAKYLCTVLALRAALPLPTTKEKP